jgi:hypothetical protein
LENLIKAGNSDATLEIDGWGDPIPGIVKRLDITVNNGARTSVISVWEHQHFPAELFAFPNDPLLTVP